MRLRKGRNARRRSKPCHRAARLVKGTPVARRGRKATGPKAPGRPGCPGRTSDRKAEEGEQHVVRGSNRFRPGRTAMLARMRKAQEEREGGFSLIELLVVMIIIGILAAIAIPIFLNQRKKAQDSAAKADVSTIGKEIATYYVDNNGVPAVT